MNYDWHVLEEVLLKALKKLHPDVFGHIVSVRRDEWLAVYVHFPTRCEKAQHVFAKIVEETNVVVKHNWHTPPVRHDGYMGICSLGNHFYTFWLSVHPPKSV